MVADDLGDDEGEELLGEDRVEARLRGELAQPRHLPLLAGRVRRRQVELGLEHPHLLGAPEALGEQVHQGGVEIVDGGAVGGEPGRYGARPRPVVRRAAGPGRRARRAHAVRLRPLFMVAARVPEPAS